MPWLMPWRFVLVSSTRVVLELIKCNLFMEVFFLLFPKLN